MAKPSPLRVGVVLVLALVLLVILGAVMLIPPFFSRFNSPRTSAAASASDTADADAALVKARALVARVREEIVPREGLATDYGVTFSDAGYQALQKCNADYKVEPSYARAFESLDLMLPCCEWSHPSRDEKSNCACGHHQVLEGLAKKLLAEGRSAAVVQGEVIRWSRYMFPKEALTAELEKRAQLDPEMKAALDELRAHGEC